MNRPNPAGNKNGVAPGTKWPDRPKRKTEPEPRPKPPPPKHPMFAKPDDRSVWDSLADIFFADERKPG